MHPKPAPSLPLQPDDPEQALARVGDRDHSQTNHYRIFGPPGTGKTWHLIRQIMKALLRHGPRILVTSHTRTAALELVNRLGPLAQGDPERELQIEQIRKNVRTLHSHCYRALADYQKAPIHLASSHVSQWNQQHPGLLMTLENEGQSAARLEEGLAALGLSENASSQDLPDPDAVYRDRTRLNEFMSHDASRIPRGDLLLAELNRLRGLEETRGPHDQRSALLREFEELWTLYKHTHNPPLVDFTDLIQFALEHIHIAPGNPIVLFVDEAQDFNRMQSRLIKQWGRMAEYFVEAGDDDQVLFSFSGASPDSLLSPPLPQGHHIVLSQSQRLPRKIFDLAERWIHQIPPERRQAKTYAPRDAAGRISLISPARLEKTIHEELTLIPPEPGRPPRTVMILASCRYQLAPALRLLRDRYIPFHNPYRPSANEWNPLREGRYALRTQVLALLGIFERPWWTLAELDAFTHGLSISKDGGKTGALLHGARASLERAADAFPDQPLAPTVRDLSPFLCPQALADLAASLAGDMEPDQQYGPTRQRGNFLLKWWQSYMKPPSRGKASPWIRFSAQAALHCGRHALEAPPRVIVGTIHSVKGGEADAVILHQDLSPVAHAAWGETNRRPPANGHPLPAGRDSLIRLFYVAITRARSHLYLVPPPHSPSPAIERFLT